MRKYFVPTISVIILTVFIGVAIAGEFGSIFVWYPGDNTAGAPPAQLSSNMKFNVGYDEYVKTVTVKGYGEMVKRLNIVFYDKYGKIGKSLVKLSQAQVDAQGNYIYIYTVNQPDRWKAVALEYSVYNFKRANRVYDGASLFWIDSVTSSENNTYQLEQPADDDDVIQP